MGNISLAGEESGDYLSPHFLRLEQAANLNPPEMGLNFST